MYDLKHLAHYLNCSVLEIVERLKTGRMTGDDYQQYLICAQADEAVEAQRRRERERNGR